MEKNNVNQQEFKFQKWTDMSVKVHSCKDTVVPNRLLRGRALLNLDEADLTFVENAPRGPRSVEVGRTNHSRFVRRHDNGYTLTFRFFADEKYLQSTLIAEVRNIVKAIQADSENQKAKKAKEAKNVQDDNAEQ